MMMRLFFFLALALQLSATTYYVDCNAADDTKDGMSPANAWKSLAKVSRVSFSAGDSILFDRGCTWQDGVTSSNGEYLNVTTSGSSGSPITYSVYGSGAAPVFDGSRSLSGFTEDAPSDHKWYASWLSDPEGVVYLKGTRLTPVASLTTVMPGTYWWDSADNRLYVYAASNPSGNVLVGYEHSGIVISGKSYIVVDGLHERYYQQIGISISGAGSGRTIQNCEAESNGETGINDSSNGNLNDVIGPNNLVHDNVEGGIYIWGTSATQNVEIEANHVYNNINEIADGHNYGDAVHVQYVTSGLKIHHNYIDRPAPFVPVAGSNAEGIDFSTNVNGALVYDNVVFGCYMDAKNGSTGNFYYNNTVYVPANANCTSAFFADSTASGQTLRNNILVDLRSGAYYAVYIDGAEAGTTSDYNLIYAPSAKIGRANGTDYNTLAAWRGAGFDSHSVSTDPKLNNAPEGDFTLQAGSPAIDAGTSLGSAFQLGLDPGTTFPWSTLNQNSYGAGWEIGAFVFVQPSRPAPPTGLSAVVQ
jgi:hypothetical protein